MNTKIIREFDNQGRINIKADLLELCEFEKKTKIAICRLSDSQIMLRKLNDLKNCEVIGLGQLEEKGRIAISPEIRDKTSKVEMYVKNGSLIIEEAH